MALTRNGGGQAQFWRSKETFGENCPQDCRRGIRLWEDLVAAEAVLHGFLGRCHLYKHDLHKLKENQWKIIAPFT